jgi:hypothetical protein
MSENTDGGSAETTELATSGEVDAQLAEMQQAEKPEANEPAETVKETVKEERVVPLAALHEERRARQALARQLEETQRKQQERDELIERRLAALSPKRELPDKENAPVEYLDHRIDEVHQTQRQILERDEQRRQEEEQQRAIQQVSEHVVRSGNEFAKANPDFREAIHHLNQLRAKELMVLEGMDPSIAMSQAEQQLDIASMQWTAKGLNPAQVAYELAKAKGYQVKAQTAVEKIAAQQKGTAAARSLGGGGGVVGGKLTAEALASMSDEDFAKLSESDWRKAMGG